MRNGGTTRAETLGSGLIPKSCRTLPTGMAQLVAVHFRGPAPLWCRAIRLTQQREFDILASRRVFGHNKKELLSRFKEVFLTNALLGHSAGWRGARWPAPVARITDDGGLAGAKLASAVVERQAMGYVGTGVFRQPRGRRGGGHLSGRPRR